MGFYQKQLGLILGSEPKKFGALELDKYVDTSVIVPDVVERPSNAANYQYGMLDNDSYGDCVAASQYHMQETFRLKQGISPYPWFASTCLATYFHENNVPPGPPGSGSDQGTDPSVAMQYWQTNGLPGHKIAGFGVLNTNSPNIKRAIWEFGSVMFAVALPVYAQGQGVFWRNLGRLTGDGTPGSWGGHAIAGDSYSSSHLGFISWGQKGDMDLAFWGNYGEMVLVPVSVDQIDKATGVGPGGFDLAQMKKDLASL